MTGSKNIPEWGQVRKLQELQSSLPLSADPNTSLRKKAEERFQQVAQLTLDQVAALSPEASQKLIHELGVHQIELEMQNDELRESQVALDAARERYFDLYDLAPVGYCTISENGIVLQANLTAATLFGIVRSALLKQPVSRLIYYEDQHIYYQHRKRLALNDDRQVFELRMVKNDGEQFWVQITMTIGRDTAGGSELRVVLVDINERKQTEAERVALLQTLHEKNLELKYAVSVAETANHAKSDFLARMSHELRTPLHSILGFGQLMEIGPPDLPPEQKHSVEQILTAGWHLLELVNEVLDLAAIESGKVVMSLEPVAMATVMRECETMLAPLALEHEVKLLLPANETSCFVNADRVRIKQVLINLLSNAIKYNRKGGTVTTNYVAKAPGRLSICVADTGPGLTPEELTQIFQPFNRLKQAHGNEQGTGIGLVVSKQLVELMGGTIGVECLIGEGCMFWIELDRVAPGLIEAQAAAT